MIKMASLYVGGKKTWNSYKPDGFPMNFHQGLETKESLPVKEASASLSERLPGRDRSTRELTGRGEAFYVNRVSTTLPRNQ